MTPIEILLSGLDTLKEYLSAHVLTCLVPAFFIAGAIAVFVSKTTILNYFGVQAKKYISYSIASVSGAILAVCSCTVLPLFAGIYKRGAGIGPATTFLFSGPAINILAIILTARVLGFEIGLARVIGAVFMSIFIGLLMAFIFAGIVVSLRNHRWKRTRPLLAIGLAALISLLPYWQIVKRAQDWVIIRKIPIGWRSIWQMFSTALGSGLHFMPWLWVGLFVLGIITAIYFQLVRAKSTTSSAQKDLALDQKDPPQT